jgi:mitochondrial protein import protein ZIM17
MAGLPAGLRHLSYRQISLPNLAFPSLRLSQLTKPSLSRRLSTATGASRSLTYARSNFRPNTLQQISKHQRRAESSLAVPGSNPQQPDEALRPSYQLTFTCKPCGHRSSHRITKQGYHHGTVLIQCPGCKDRHVIADHLRVFLDQKSTLEDILAKKTTEGTPLTDLVKRGQLGIRQGAMVGNEGEEDIEFWEDGTETMHEKPAETF